METDDIRGFEHTGFPSPAREFAEAPLDLHRLLVKNTPATYFFRLADDAPEFKLFAGDLLVVDRALEAAAGALVLVVIEGEHVIRKLVDREGKLGLYDGIHTVMPESLDVLGVIRASVTMFTPCF